MCSCSLDSVVKSDALDSVVVLGTGDTLKRVTLPLTAPSKPPRTNSIKRHHTIDVDNEDESKATPPSGEPTNETSPTDKTTSSEEMAAGVSESEAVKDMMSSESQAGVSKVIDSAPEITVTVDPLPVHEKVDQAVVNTLPMAEEREAKEKADGESPSLKEPPPTDKEETGTKQDDRGQQVVEEMQSVDKAAEEGDVQVTGNHTEPTKPAEPVCGDTCTPPSKRNPIPDQVPQSDSHSKTESAETKSDSTTGEQQSIRKDSFNMSRTQRVEDSLFEAVELMGKLTSRPLLLYTLPVPGCTITLSHCCVRDWRV